jgi:hypothetical protein
LRARAPARRRIEEVARVEEIPLPVVVAEWVGIDSERTGDRIDQRDARVLVRTFGILAQRHAELVRLVLVADGVVEEESTVRGRDFRRPEAVTERRVGPHERVAARLPLHEIGRAQQWNHAAARVAAPRFGRTRADRVVQAGVPPHERVREVPVVDRRRERRRLST